MNQNQRPFVGVGSIVIKNNKVLLLKRTSSLGNDTWCFPGGHLEFKETFEEAVRRETLEESGVAIKNTRFITATNDLYEKENIHYVTIFMLSDYDHGEAKIMEPEKSSEIGWFDWNNLPSPLLLPVEILVKSGFSPF